MQFITWLDYVLLPFYIGIIYIFAYNFRNTHYPPGHPWRPFFIPGLTVKIGGAIFIGLIYQYYYGGGDTVHYFEHAQVINSAFWDSPIKWLNLVFHNADWYSGEYSEYVSRLYWYTTLNNYAVGAVAAVLGLLTLDTFLPTSVLFAAVSFTGMWAMFRTFAKQYPLIVRRIALVTLFIPSTFVWGSGIFKDTLCMFGLGWLLYSTYYLILQRSFNLKTVLLGLIGFYLLYTIKLYILVAFVPALLFWLFISYSSRIRSGAVRFITGLTLSGVVIGSIVLISDRLTKELGQYSVESIVATSTITREYIYGASGEQGSSYDIGTIDPSVTGMLSKAPQAINVALFRPYLWESRKPIVLANAIEAFLFLFVTLRVIFTVGFSNIGKAVSTDPNIQFCLIFTLIFAFAVGISSGNFGALSRYRIPCLPMYGLALVLIYYKYKPADKPIISLR